MPSGNTEILIKSNDQKISKAAQMDKEQKKKLATMSLLAHQTIANTQKILNYGVANIGNFTGDYTKSAGLQFGMSVVGDVATIGAGAAAGPIGLAIAVTGVALNKTLEAVTYFQDLKHKEIETDYLRQRSGNVLTNGSRGTEN